jgi:hypothetical protein
MAPWAQAPVHLRQAVQLVLHTSPWAWSSPSTSVSMSQTRVQVPQPRLHVAQLRLEVVQPQQSSFTSRTLAGLILLKTRSSAPMGHS